MPSQIDLIVIESMARSDVFPAEIARPIGQSTGRVLAALRHLGLKPKLQTAKSSTDKQRERAASLVLDSGATFKDAGRIVGMTRDAVAGAVFRARKLRRRG